MAIEPIKQTYDDTNDQADNTGGPNTTEPGGFIDKPFDYAKKELAAPDLEEDEGKDFLVAFLLSFFLGTLAIDRFYLGHIGVGILKLITLGGFGIWAFIDVILILAGSTRDKQGHRLKNRDKYLKLAIAIFVSVYALSFLAVFTLLALGR